MLYITTFTYIFKVTNIEMWVSRYMNGSRKRLCIVANFQRIFSPVCGGGGEIIFGPVCVWEIMEVYYFSPQLCILFHLFQVKWKTLMSVFLRIARDSFADYDQSTRRSIKKCAAWKEVTAQLSLHFPGGKCNLKKRKKRCISPTRCHWFSSSLHQNHRTMAGHLILVTGNLENVGHDQKLQEFSFLKCEFL